MVEDVLLLGVVKHTHVPPGLLEQSGLVDGASDVPDAVVLLLPLL